MAYTGKVALVTGGGSGMGQLAARNFAEAGAKVAVLDVNAAGLAETVASHENISSYEVDITQFDQVDAAVKSIESTLGAIDRVYNCAAIMPLGKLLEQEVGVIHKMMDINYGGLVNIARATLPAMIERQQGQFVSFSSMSGITPAMVMGAYAASKAAAAMYTEILYHENRDSGVQFTCVCPPPVATPLLKQGLETEWPKIMAAQEGKEMLPQQVIDEVEQAIEKDQFWVFPGKGTRMGYIMRRFFPAFVWNYVHKTEGW